MRAKTPLYWTIAAAAVFTLAAVINALTRQWLVAGIWGVCAVLWLIAAFRQWKKTTNG
jgi:uncharacterized membrane protein YjjB (DUF3815 family)